MCDDKLLNEGIKIKGRVVAKIDGKKLLEEDNLILKTGYDYIANLIGGYTGEGASFGVESIVVGDNGDSAKLSQTDILGNQLNEGLIDDTESGLVSGTDNDRAELKLKTLVTNNSGHETTHKELALVNTSGTTTGNRISLSRIVLNNGNGLTIENGVEVTYIWYITVSV